MQNQSRYIKHIYYNEELNALLDTNDLFIKYDNRGKIEDVDLFIRELKRANLYNEDLDKFISNYMKFSND